MYINNYMYIHTYMYINVHTYVHVIVYVDSLHVQYTYNTDTNTDTHTHTQTHPHTHTHTHTHIIFNFVSSLTSDILIANNFLLFMFSGNDDKCVVSKYRVAPWINRKIDR